MESRFARNTVQAYLVDVNPLFYGADVMANLHLKTQLQEARSKKWANDPR